MPSPLISVIVCSYRRPRLLERFLPSLCDQSLDPRHFEVIVVDNGPCDATVEVVARMRTRYHNLRYLQEPRRGLSHARNRGWQTAAGTYVAYVDDECKAPREWLAVAKEVIETHGPIEFGGPIHALFQCPKPRWWRSAYDAAYDHCYADRAGYLPSEYVIFGGNLFLRRSSIASVGGFDPRLGMQGRHLGYEEERDLHRRIQALHPGHRAYLEPRLGVDHLIRPEKLSLCWYLRDQISRGRDTHLIGCGGQPVFDQLGAVRFLVAATAKVVSLGLEALLCRDRSVHPHWRNVLYESAEMRRCCLRLGQLLAQRAQQPRWSAAQSPGECERCLREASEEHAQ